MKDHNAMDFVRRSLSSMKKLSLRRTADLISDDFISAEEQTCKFEQWYLAALHIIEPRIYIPDAPKVAKDKHM